MSNSWDISNSNIVRLLLLEYFSEYSELGWNYPDNIIFPDLQKKKRNNYYVTLAIQHI